MKSKLLFITLSLLLVSGGSLFAQGIPADAPPEHVLKVVLHLSEDQVIAMQELHEARVLEIESIAAEVHLLHGRLQQLIMSDEPDPIEVGELVLTIRMLQQEIERQQQRWREDFRSLLTPEQMKRVGHINRTALALRAAKALGQLGLR